MRENPHFCTRCFYIDISLKPTREIFKKAVRIIRKKKKLTLNYTKLAEA